MRPACLLIFLPLLSWSQSRTGTLRSPNNPDVQPATASSMIQPIKIGDAVPNRVLNTINYPLGSPRQAAPKHRLLILDFWATWCTACLHSFPKLDSLQQQFGDSLQVILVNEKSTRDDEKKIRAFFEKHRSPSGKPYRFPLLNGDTILNRLFPHKLIPHYVWILNNLLVAITSASELTPAHIRSFLKNQTPQLRTKADILQFDNTKPLFADGNGATTAAIRHRSLISAYLEGLPSGTFINRDSAGRITRLCITNTSILKLYQYAWGAFSARVKMEVTGPEKLTHDGDWEEWKYNNTWTYELICPPSPDEKAWQRMQLDLIQFFGYHATLENHSGTQPLFTIFENHK